MLRPHGGSLRADATHGITSGQRIVKLTCQAANSSSMHGQRRSRGRLCTGARVTLRLLREACELREDVIRELEGADGAEGESVGSA